MRIFLILTVIFLFPVTIWGANCGVSPTTYYVDYVGGNDSNNGTSTSTPWKHTPGNPTYKNCTLQPGDKVIFKGGVAYRDQVNVGMNGPVVVNVNASGSGDADNQRIIYDGNSAGTFGTGKAIVDGQSTALKGFSINGRSYITINNFIIRDGWTNLANDSAINLVGDTGDFGNSSHYITVSYNDMSHAGIYAPSPRWCNEIGQNCYDRSGRCVQNYGGNYWKIHHNTFTDCGTAGTNFSNVNHLEVYNNTYTGTMTWPWGIGYGGTNKTWTDIKFHDNIMYDTNVYYIPIGNGHTNWFYNFIPYGSTGNTISNFQYYNNTVYNTSNTRPNSGCNFQYYELNDTNTWDGLYIFNNVFFNPEGATAANIINRDEVHQQAVYKNVYILNNSFHSNNTSESSFFNYFTFSCNAASQFNIYVRNNIAYQVASGGVILQFPQVTYLSDTVLFSNNNYNCTNPSCFLVRSNCGTPAYTNWSTWKTIKVGSGDYFDSSGSTFGQNPYFKSVTPGSFDLHLTSNSTSCIGKGADLTSYCATIPALCYDKDGKQRPSVGNWDIGAYEFTGTNPGAPNPPTNLKMAQ